MDTPTENGQEVLALKKALEWELSLDSRDLRSHAWYHGPIPRQRAEEIVLKEGDFLIRDCVSQPGNYVLTCKSKGPTLHFVINKVSFFGNLSTFALVHVVVATCYLIQIMCNKKLKLFPPLNIQYEKGEK